MANLGLYRVAVVSPELRIADVRFNIKCIIDALEKVKKEKTQLVVFPELCITGYSCADLFYQELLLQETLIGLKEIVRHSNKLKISIIVGLPLEKNGRIYNCAAMISCGEIIGIVPKSYLPTTKEYYEERWFTSGRDIHDAKIRVNNLDVPFGTDLIFKANEQSDITIGIEICEDLWACQPPSGGLALAGATIIANPSASNELLGKVEYRRDLVRQQSARCSSAYLYAGAGPNESTTDTVFGGHSIIAENGTILAETKRFLFDTQIAIADVDIQQLKSERKINSCFSSDSVSAIYRECYFEMPKPGLFSDNKMDIRRKIERFPFVPYNKSDRSIHCEEIFSIQIAGLIKRYKHTRIRKAIIGVSGGLDSTLALLVTVKAFDLLEYPRSDIIAVMMPGIGSSERTKYNSAELISGLGTGSVNIPIRTAVSQHFDDIGHDENQHDVTFENAQARERTQILMDLSNKHEGLVVGTGDLSEFALGWCTYNGDHMSMYHINAGVPKTLVRSMVEWCAEERFDNNTSNILHDICDTPITPELLPLDGKGSISQLTEDIIGPYELHDFFLFNAIRYQFTPEKIIYLAMYAFKGDYTKDEIAKWLNVFYKRFFSQQFKRSAMPDGPKIGSVSLSPRADWRMPSDASADLWIK